MLGIVFIILAIKQYKPGTWGYYFAHIYFLIGGILIITFSGAFILEQAKKEPFYFRYALKINQLDSKYQSNILIILMFIGASPGSTGGGIKTSTFFVLIQQIRSLFTKRHVSAFRRSIPAEAISKASTITLLSMALICVGTFFLCILEPEYSFVQLLFEDISAFGTVGLSTGITPDLCDTSKVIIILTMFAGRVGTFTLLSIWVDRPAPTARYTEESITIG